VVKREGRSESLNSITDMAEVKYEVVKNEATVNVSVFLTISMLFSLLTSWLGGFLLNYMTTQQMFLA